MPDGHRRTRGRRRRAYERRRRTRRRQVAAPYPQRGGGKDELIAWLNAADAHRRRDELDINNLQFSALELDALALKPGVTENAPELENYDPKSLADIMTSIAARIGGKDVTTGARFAAIMGLLREQDPDVYAYIEELEDYLTTVHKAGTASPSQAPPPQVLLTPTPSPIPFLWVAYANLKATDQQLEAPLPVLIHLKDTASPT